MADIFISYARADRDRIEKLAAALEGEGYSVWWDRHIQSGKEFSADIERELLGAKAVIVCWSAEGSNSRWVKDEANIAAEEGKLLAICLDEGLPPIGFRQYHAVDFSGWKSGGDDAAFRDLADSVRTRLTEGAGDTAPATPPAKSPGPAIADPKVWGSVLVALLVLAAAVVFTRGGEDAPAPQEAVSEKIQAGSIAVLPFDDLSPDKDQEYFSDGISEEILNVLARVSGLKVASRTSAFVYKDKTDMSVSDIAAELGVRYVLEGSVRKAGDNVRVTAQLIETDSDRHLWSQTYDRMLTAENIFFIQDEIAGSIVEALGERDVISGVDRENIRSAAGTDNLRAYELFLEGRKIFVERFFPKFGRMVEAFEQAVEIDPQFARAHAALAAAYLIQPGWGRVDRDYLALSKQSAREALAIDPDLALPYAVLAGTACPDSYTACPQSLDYQDRAIALDPRDPTLLNWRGQEWLDLGFFEEAIDDFSACLDLDPAYINCEGHLAVASVLNKQYDEAVAIARRIGAERVAGLQVLDVAVELYAVGREEEARSLLVTTPERLGDFSILISNLETLRDPNADITPLWEEAAAHWAERGLTVRDLPDDVSYLFRRFDNLNTGSGLPVYWLSFHREYLQSPERYALMKEIGLVDYWRERGFPPQCREIDPLPDGRDYECNR